MKYFLIAVLSLLSNISYCQNSRNLLEADQIASRHFGNDKQWYIDNIPFFECSDKKIEEVYYYRWKLYKAHLKNIGENGYIVTEFLNTMGWDLKPFNSLNDATGFHIYEGRWLKDTRYVSDYINYMYQKGGNDRHFSEAIADAAYAYYLVHPNKAFIVSQLASMVNIYNKWNDHLDTSKSLYYIEPLLDATEYTISSIDASGGKDGFRGGDAFRPSINSYMYANAIAIKNIALLQHDSTTAKLFQKRAQKIKTEMQKSLWSNEMQHFIDRYKVSNQHVKYWNFIRGRELVGFVPWTYNIPDDNKDYNAAWQHILSFKELKGVHGLRTNEPSYEYYMQQYRYDKATGQRECQWNGPSWPFQTSQVLLGMANLLNNYRQHTITVKDYFEVLEQYTLQHYMADGQLNIVEDYDADNGGPIVNLPQRSEHYNHSEYNDLIITGLCGLRPSAGDSIVIDPLVDTDNLKYFCLQQVAYHGHALSIIYDKTGNKYKQGIGLSVYVDGKKVLKNASLKRQVIQLPAPILEPTSKDAIDLAVNVMGNGFPKASASFNDSAKNTNMANDGRIWYFTDVKNYWSNDGSKNDSDWYQIDFDTPKNIREIDLYFYADNKRLIAPTDYKLNYWTGNSWEAIKDYKKHPIKPTSGVQNKISFKPIQTNKVRVVLKRGNKLVYTALAEIEIF